MTKPTRQPPVPDTPEPAAPQAAPDGGVPPDPPLRGRNAGVGTGRPSEDDRAGEHQHNGWNSNT